MAMNYRTIMAQFNSQGLSENSLVTFQQLQDVLDRLMRKSTNESVPIFNHQISEELWGQSRKNANGQISISQYAQVLGEAKQILEQRIFQTKEKIKAKNSERQQLSRQIANIRNSYGRDMENGLRQRLQDIQYELNQLEEDYKNFDTDYKVISIPFTRDDFRRSGAAMSLALPNDARMINGRLQNSMRMHSQFFMSRSSTALTIIFYLSILLLLTQMLVMFQKHHFLGILSSLLVLGIFALNYFNTPYVQLILGVLATSVILDIVWFLLYFKSFWTPTILSQLPQLFPGFLKLILLAVIIVVCIKVILFLILFSYRNVQEQGDVSCCCCTISVFPQSGPFRGSVRQSYYQPGMM